MRSTTGRFALVLLVSMCLLFGAGDARSDDKPTVTNINAACRNGQTFVTWTDAAEAEAGSKYRYSLYRADQPITHENLAKAELCYPGVLNNSCVRYGYAYWMKDRINPASPTYIIETGGQPLPMWTGLAVRTVPKDGKSFYAVMVTDEKYQPIGQIVPGKSATLEAVEEKVAPIQPILQKAGSGSAAVTGKANLPLNLSLHGSEGRGGASKVGNVFIYFGTREMGWRDGLPGSFSVFELREKELFLGPRDAIESVDGNGVTETCWFGYYCVPFGAEVKEPRAYPFTENRLAWMVDWVVRNYKADPMRVYSGGQSMGGMGSTQWAWRRPDIFAAVYPKLTRVRQSWMPVVPKGLRKASEKRAPATMADGRTDYFADHMDSIKYAATHHEDLPFYGICAGRRDWVETWRNVIDMVESLTASHHGFALAWTNGGHDDIGAKGASLIRKYYPPAKFARNKSFPAFGNSSIDDNMGTGELDEKKELKDGDLVGGINLGFDWQDVTDEDGKWSAGLSNDLCKAEMTVDVTPRWCQKFKAKPGEKLSWTSSIGDSGQVVADEWGLVTVRRVRIQPGKPTTLTISR